jgi:lactoylglutathione lyase
MMSANTIFNKVSPIGDTDTSALPIRSVGPAIGYYTQVLGFQVVSKEKDRAVLRRDEVTIGLAMNGADPEQASCYFGVSDVEALRVDEYGGKKYRVFFAQEPYGVCFCFGQQVEEA